MIGSYSKTNMRKMAVALAAWGLAMGAVAQERLVLSAGQCREMALAHDEELRKADNAVRQAELDKAVAFAAFLPKVEATKAKVARQITIG